MNKLFSELYNTLEFVEENTEWDRYEYNGKFVPRVTEILNLLHEEYLMKWSNAMGFKRKRYQDILQDSANVGTLAHNTIEDYIINNIDYDTLSDIRALNCFNAFKDWWSIIITNDYEILMIEEKMSCEYFGGTLDLLMKINGKIYIVDFKTSNHLNYKYLLQLAAYRYLLRVTKGIEVDGCVLLRLDKRTADFEEMMFNLEDPETRHLLNMAENEFFAMCYAYINKLYLVNRFNNWR